MSSTILAAGETSRGSVEAGVAVVGAAAAEASERIVRTWHECRNPGSVDDIEIKEIRPSGFSWFFSPSRHSRSGVPHHPGYSMSSFEHSDSVLSSAARPSKRVATSTATGAIARKIFLVKYGLQLAPGCIDWLESFIGHFAIDDEREITETFEHLVRGVVGTGSGLGTSRLSQLGVLLNTSY